MFCWAGEMPEAAQIQGSPQLKHPIAKPPARLAVLRKESLMRLPCLLPASACLGIIMLGLQASHASTGGIRLTLYE